MRCAISNTAVSLSSIHLLFVKIQECSMAMHVEQTEIAMVPSCTFFRQGEKRAKGCSFSC